MTGVARSETAEKPIAVTPAPESVATPAGRRLSAGVLKNVSSNWAGLLVSIVLSFAIAPLTVNSLGSVYYGIWTLLMQFTGYLWLFDFGVRESVVKYVAQYHAAGDRDELAATVHTAVSVYAVVSLVAMAVVSMLTMALPYAFNIPADAVGTARLTALLFGATVAQGFVFNVFVGVLMGLQKFYLMSRLGMVFGLLRAALVYGLLTAGFGIVTLAVLQFVLTLASNLLIYRYCLAELPYLTVRWVRPDRAALSRLLHYGKYVLINNVGDKIVFATDSLVIGVFLPISSLTFYAIGGGLIEQLRSFLTSMGSVLNPLSSSLEARNDARSVGTVFLTGAKAAMVIGLPVCIGFIMLGERFITLWMGETYGPPAGLVLAVLAAGHMIGLPYYTIAGVLYGVGRHRVVAQSRILEGVMNLVLSVVLVKPLGLVGVALGTAVPHVVVVGGFLPRMLPALLQVDLRTYYLSTYARPILASVPFWGACWFVGHVVQPASILSFLGVGVLALPAYVIPCWFVALSQAQRQYLIAAIRRRAGRAAAQAATEPASSASRAGTEASDAPTSPRR
jgi:O-antigen/teichoic acid export membrane protein